MSRTHYFYLPHSLKEVQGIVEAHQEEFETIIDDTFSDDELTKFEKKLDDIGAIYVQPIFSELSFDDLYADSTQEEKQRVFFNSCKSSICLENLPYFDSNPFQVTYLIDLLWCFDEVLIDAGGTSELVFKKTYLDELKKYKMMDSLLKQVTIKPYETKSSLPVDPIDFLVADVYKEIERLKALGKLPTTFEASEKGEKIFMVMKEGRLDSDSLFRKSGLNAKDFDDYLEKLKFFFKSLSCSQTNDDKIKP